MNYKTMPAKDVPVYYGNFATARADGDVEWCKRSKDLNAECAEAIKLDIYNSRRTNTWYYDMDDAIKSVVETYGTERTAAVVANSIVQSPWDGRFKNEIKAWASDIKIPSIKPLDVEVHPILLNAFAESLQKEIKRQEHGEPSHDDEWGER